MSIPSFDFGVHVARPQMAAEIALAFRHHHAGNTPGTREGCIRKHRRLVPLPRRARPGRCVHARGRRGGAAALITWLYWELSSKGSRYVVWSGVKQLFGLAAAQPATCHPGLEIPFNRFPRKNAEARQREALDSSEIEAVPAAARTDIDTSWGLFSRGERAPASRGRPCRDRARARPGADRPKDFGTLLAVIVDRFGGLVPSHRTLRHARSCGRSASLSERYGHTYRIAQYLHPIPETLIPAT